MLVCVCVCVHTPSMAFFGRVLQWFINLQWGQTIAYSDVFVVQIVHGSHIYAFTMNQRWIIALKLGDITY